jgi:putative membrane protein
MSQLIASLSGLGSFALYFGLSIVFLMLFKFVYLRITPYDEWALVKEEKNVAAAITMSGAFIGYSLAIASAATNSVGLLDFALWGVVALIAQVLAFAIVRFGFMPKLVERIINNEIPAAIVMGSMSIAIGILNAACMTY